MSPSRGCHVLHTSGVRRSGAALCQRFRRGPSGGASSGGAGRWCFPISLMLDQCGDAAACTHKGYAGWTANWHLFPDLPGYLRRRGSTICPDSTSAYGASRPGSKCCHRYHRHAGSSVSKPRRPLSLQTSLVESRYRILGDTTKNLRSFRNPAWKKRVDEWYGAIPLGSSWVQIQRPTVSNDAIASSGCKTMKTINNWKPKNISFKSRRCLVPTHWCASQLGFCFFWRTNFQPLKLQKLKNWRSCLQGGALSRLFWI